MLHAAYDVQMSRVCFRSHLTAVHEPECGLCFLQIVGAAFCYFIYAGTGLSARFDAGGSLDGRLRGLYPGWLFGRRMASLRLLCCSARAWCTSSLHNAVHTTTLGIASSSYLQLAAASGETIHAASPQA